MKKIPADKLKKMTYGQLAEYMIQITQTPICADKKYCQLLNDIMRSKPLTIHQ